MWSLPTNVTPQVGFRFATFSFAILLGVQSIWILLPELSRRGIDRFPTDAASAAAAAEGHGAAALAASLGIIRGDLWAESAFTYADLLWSQAGTNDDPARSLPRARASIVRALINAPCRSDVWLFAAALAARYPWFNLNAAEALKMSYYTGPSEPELMALRFRVAIQSGAFADSEIRELVTRDVRLFLTQNQKSAIIDAYNAASPAGKQLIEQTAGNIDPSAVDWLRPGAGQPPSAH
jgi:hypothetical protein